MRSIVLILTLMLFVSVTAQVNVNGYFRKDGTYVAPHQRTTPNDTKTDNYSYPGNYNPNTGTVTGYPQPRQANNYSDAQRAIYFHTNYQKVILDRKASIIYLNTATSLHKYKRNWYIIVDSSNNEIGYIRLRGTAKFEVYDFTGKRVHCNYNLKRHEDFAIKMINGVAIMIMVTIVINFGKFM